MPRRSFYSSQKRLITNLIYGGWTSGLYKYELSYISRSRLRCTYCTLMEGVAWLETCVLFCPLSLTFERRLSPSTSRYSITQDLRFFPLSGFTGYQYFGYRVTVPSRWYLGLTPEGVLVRIERKETGYSIVSEFSFDVQRQHSWHCTGSPLSWMGAPFQLQLTPHGHFRLTMGNYFHPSTEYCIWSTSTYSHQDAKSMNSFYLVPKMLQRGHLWITPRFS